MWTRPFAIVASMLVASACQAATSPYAQEASRQIKSLSAGEIEGYLAGGGMGLAKAAELNGYPGPKHVLELAHRLQLSSEQRERSEVVFERMRAQAQSFGAQLVQKERDLDHAFSAGEITQEQLEALTSEIASLAGKLRATHLRAHLDQRAILTEHQVRRYAQLRGYSQDRQPVHGEDPPAHDHAH